ncbi:hypothetical protein DFJ74DRAFT_712327 [Hyaloraphidium curvatum]|nr:hypothetical protein DFJ74DRAFT_712327 [Hyaloraphidium curvatum]
MARLPAALLALAASILASMASPANAQDIFPTPPAPIQCAADTAFGLPNNVPWSPSPVNAPGIVLGPITPGSYYGVMASNLSSFSSNSTHGCPEPGYGGACGTQSGQLWLTVGSSAISAVYNPLASGPVVGRVRSMGLWWSCDKPESWDDIRKGETVTRTYDACTDEYSYTISSSDAGKVLPRCADGYYVVAQAYEYSLPQACEIPGCPANSTHPAIA